MLAAAAVARACRGGARAASSLSEVASSVTLPPTPAGGPATVHSAQLLRAECYCPECRHEQTNQRLVDIKASAGVTVTGTTDTGGTLRVSFSDGHESEFSSRWQEAHTPEPGAAARDEQIDRQARALEGTLAALGGLDLPEGAEALPTDEPPSVDWGVVPAGGDGLADALAEFRSKGAVVFRGAGTGPEAVPALAAALGGARATHYGSDFKVLSKANPDSVANTGHALGFHTDLPYRAQPPELQFLHCMRNEAEGGDSTLTDGFRAAVQLYQEDPRAFSLLATVPVRFSWQGVPGVLLSAERPIVDVAPWGDLRAVHLDNRNTSLRFVTARADPSLGAEVLAAYTRFCELVDEEASTLQYRLSAGDAVLFHNRRLLHGRTAFDPSSGARELHGCYLDMDMLESKLRAVSQASSGNAWGAPSNFARPADWVRS